MCHAVGEDDRFLPEGLAKLHDQAPRYGEVAPDLSDRVAGGELDVQKEAERGVQVGRDHAAVGPGPGEG